jgi:hypothetical protein
MYRTLVFILCLALLPAFVVKAEEAVAVEGSAAVEESAEAKMISGMSIVGNDEAPKALYIVPWKSSEIGVETSLAMMLTESAMPVDREVFMRQLEFFEVSMESARRDH